MKIQVLSDLHIEFNRYQRDVDICVDVDVVVLAGDIGVDPEYTFNWIFDNCRHKEVVFVPGNHEYYHNIIGVVNCLYKQYAKENDWFHYLQNGDYKVIQGQGFIGGTLWTDFNSDDLLTKMQCATVMSDFAVIKDHDGYAIGTKTVQDIHYATVVAIDQALKKDEKAVVVTHHLPHPLCINDKFKDDYYINGAYATNLDWLFVKHPDIPFWFNGHTHIGYDIELGKTRIICNPYGYEHHEVNEDFNPNLVVEI